MCVSIYICTYKKCHIQSKSYNEGKCFKQLYTVYLYIHTHTEAIMEGKHTSYKYILLIKLEILIISL